MGHFVINRRSFWELGSILLLNSPERHIHWTSAYPATFMLSTIFIGMIKFRKFLTISDILVAPWRTWEVELCLTFGKCLEGPKAWGMRGTILFVMACFLNRAYFNGPDFMHSLRYGKPTRNANILAYTEWATIEAWIVFVLRSRMIGPLLRVRGS